MADKRVVLVTCASEEEASRIARALVSGRLAACVNILDSPVRSVYRWKGRIQTAMEHLLVIKTRRSRVRALEAAVASMHSYQTPEIIALPISEGSHKYLSWVAECVGAERKTPARTRRAARRHR